MPKSICLLLVILFISCSSSRSGQSEKNTKPGEDYVYADFTGSLKAEKIAKLKDYYNWKEEEILIINYRQPLLDCHFNNHKITSDSKKWWTQFYSKIDTDNSLNISVFADGEKIREKMDNRKFFDDKDDFLLNNFFIRKKSCFGILVVNQQGDYFQYNGHYSEKQVETFIMELKGQRNRG